MERFACATGVSIQHQTRLTNLSRVEGCEPVAAMLEELAKLELTGYLLKVQEESLQGWGNLLTEDDRLVILGIKPV